MRIGNYPEGTDIALLNTIYHFPTMIGEHQWTDGSIDLIVKDNRTGEKFLETIENPNYEYYIINPDIYVDHNYFFIEEEKATKQVVPYKSLLKDIANKTGNLEFYMDNIHNKNRGNNLNLHTCQRIMCSDSNIEDHYRFLFSKEYLNQFGPITKSYFDIEVDSINAKGDFVEPGECPVNAITIIDDKTYMVHTFLLRNPDNPLIQEFEDSVGEGLYEELKQFVIEHVGGEQKAAKFKVDLLNFRMHFFDDEKNLIKTFFDYVNEIKPDFVLAWNMAFDVPYLIARIKALGDNPVNYMCHPDFKYKEAKYIIDVVNYNEPAERNDFAKISSYSVWLDQLIQFASRRKGRSAIASFRLDYIGEITCGVRKYDYKHITSNLAKLPYLDFKTFVFYNVMDTICQYCIENTVNDIGNVYNNVLVNNTRYSKAYRQTVYLKNRAIKSFYNKGLIMGNNVNKNTPKVKFPGAFVSDPTHNNDNAKIRINGRPVSIYDNLDDFDYKALYPSITSEFNMAPNTIIAHLTIPEIVNEFENRFNRDAIKYKREGQFMEDLQSHVWLEFFHRWFKLASYREMYDDVIEYYSKIKLPVGDLQIHDQYGRIPVFKKVPINPTKDAFIKIRNCDDNNLYNGNKDIQIVPFNFADAKVNFFKDLFDRFSKNPYQYKGDVVDAVNV